jgi:hypothetical protein
MTWFSKKHLDDAAKIAELTTTNKIHKYCWHFVLSIKEAGMLFLLGIGSVIHAFFPWILDFKLLEWRIIMLKNLKKKLPRDPLLKKIDFND